MPWAPKKPCAVPGCAALTTGRYCQPHGEEARQRAAEKDRARGSSSARLYGYKWQQASQQFLREHPLCECNDCQAGVVAVVSADVVDHIIPHRGDLTLFWDQSNWRAMAKRHHDRKTAREDGAFGRPRTPGGG